MIYARALSLLPSSRSHVNKASVPLRLTIARTVKRYGAVKLSLTSVAIPKLGYIAGTGDGILTVNAIPARREVLLMDANSKDYKFIGRVWSNAGGHYMFTNLDPDKEYLVMARDYKKQFESFAYDYVTPATDLTPDEQRALRISWKQ